MKLICALALALVAAPAPARSQEAVDLTTPRGARVEVIVERPKGEGPFPAVVLAPGGGYHMRLPIMKRTAEALVSQGVAVYRFDWAYQVAGGNVSAQPRDRSLELEDMRAVIGLVREDRQVDATRIGVAGKSLGSIIAWRVLREEPAIVGAILLTPVCSQPSDDAASTNYPELAEERRPRLWIQGDSDPLCSVPRFHRFLAEGGGGDRLAVISGDHNLEVPGDLKGSERALDLAARLTADFAATMLIPAKKGP